MREAIMMGPWDASICFHGAKSKCVEYVPRDAARVRLWLWTVGLPSTTDKSKHDLNYSV